MTQNLISASRLAAVINTRKADRNFLLELLKERKLVLDCHLIPFGTDHMIGERIRLLGGMAGHW